MYAIRQAEQKDIGNLTDLLDTANLHTVGIEEHVSHFFVVEQIEKEKLVGMIGMEVYKSHGLLRSFVIERPQGDLKLSVTLLNTILSYAETLKIQRVYLVTKQGSPFLTEFGFREISTCQLPAEVIASDYFKQVHPQGCIMVYDCEE